MGQHANLGRQQRQKLVADVRIIVHRLAEHGFRHFGDDRIGDRDDRGRARQAVDGCELAEIFSVAKVAQDHFLAGNRLDQDPQMPCATK